MQLFLLQSLAANCSGFAAARSGSSTRRATETMLEGLQTMHCRCWYCDHPGPGNLKPGIGEALYVIVEVDSSAREAISRPCCLSGLPTVRDETRDTRSTSAMASVQSGGRILSRSPLANGSCRPRSLRAW